MNPNRIRIIAVLISLALGALIAIQILWLNDALEVKDIASRNSIRQALDNTVQQLEEVEALEVLFEVAQESYSEQFFDTSAINPDEIQPFEEREFLPQGYVPHLKTEDESGLQQPELFDFYLQIVIDDPAQRDSSSQIIERILADTSLVQSEVFIRNMIERLRKNSNRSLSERINFLLLDSLLKSELSIREIDMPYTYQIVKADPLLANELSDKGYFEKEEGLLAFASLLFPGDYVEKDYFLLLNVEFDNRMLYRDLFQPLWFSMLFVLLIGIGVYYLISTIQRQKKLSEMKTDFINNMTHELKTPISTIALASEALIESGDVSQNMVSRYGTMISEENTRLKKHVERILNTSLLDRGELELNPIPLDIHSILQKLCQQTELRMNQVDGKFVKNFKAETVQVEGDEMHITNVFYNMIDNAIKYNEGELVLEIRTKNINNGVLISFKDNGIGMSASQQKRVFEKFYRVPTGDLHAVKGFGLGLSYVKRIIEAHGGFLSLLSRPGKGSTFNIFLPFKTADF